MKAIYLLIALTVAASAIAATPPNPAIDFPGFLKDATETGKVREGRRLTEEQFAELAAKASTILLDARSADKFALLHIAGAVNLPLPDFSEEALAAIIPDKTTPVLIYCNNNFDGDEIAMVRKSQPASLNVYTFTSLHSYGYDNVYELAPLQNLQDSGLKFEGAHAKNGSFQLPNQAAVLFGVPKLR